MRSLISVDLPAPDGPTRNTKSPSGITRSTSARAVLPFGYVFVTSWRTRTARSTPIPSRLRRRRRSRIDRVGATGVEVRLTLRSGLLDDDGDRLLDGPRLR